MKGRRVGVINITVETIEKIKELTEQGMFRKDIASLVDVCPKTVYIYQKKLGLI